MLSRLTKSKIKRHTSQRNLYFRDARVITGGTENIEVIHNFGGPEYPGDVWDLIKLNFTYGIFDDPIDENWDYSLNWMDPSNPVWDVADTTSAVWGITQNFRVLSSVGVIQTVENVNVDFADKQAYEGSQFDTENLIMGVVGPSSGSMIAHGNLIVDVTLEQKQTADDRSEYEPDFLFEETTDEEEQQYGHE